MSLRAALEPYDLLASLIQGDKKSPEWPESVKKIIGILERILGVREQKIIGKYKKITEKIATINLEKPEGKIQLITELIKKHLSIYGYGPYGKNLTKSSTKKINEKTAKSPFSKQLAVCLYLIKNLSETEIEELFNSCFDDEKKLYDDKCILFYKIFRNPFFCFLLSQMKKDLWKRLDIENKTRRVVHYCIYLMVTEMLILKELDENSMEIDEDSIIIQENIPTKIQNFINNDLQLEEEKLKEQKIDIKRITAFILYHLISIDCKEKSIFHPTHPSLMVLKILLEKHSHSRWLSELYVLFVLNQILSRKENDRSYNTKILGRFLDVFCEEIQKSLMRLRTANNHYPNIKNLEKKDLNESLFEMLIFVISIVIQERKEKNHPLNTINPLNVIRQTQKHEPLIYNKLIKSIELIGEDILSRDELIENLIREIT